MGGFLSFFFFLFFFFLFSFFSPTSPRVDFAYVRKKEEFVGWNRVAGGGLFENFGMYVFSISFQFSHLYFYDTLFSFSFFLSFFIFFFYFPG